MIEKDIFMSLDDAELLRYFTPYPGEAESFWSKVKRTTPTGCWLWQGFVEPAGYGRVKFDDRKMRSHQAAWMLHHHLQIPAKGRLMLSCGNKQCCNPAHIFLGTTRWDAESNRWVKVPKENGK